VAEAYIQDQLGAKFFNAERAGTWMQQRVEELRIQAGEAVQALEDFKLRSPAVAQKPSTGQLEDAASGREAADELRRLEAAAQRKKTLYDNLLNRYHRVVQFVEQQSFPVTEARVVTKAMPPLTKSYPKTTLILAVALFAGGMVGIAGALAREYFDRSVCAPERIEQELGVNCLGFLPPLPCRADGSWRSTAASSSRRERALPIFGDSGTSHSAGETLRAIKVAIDRGHHQGAKVVAIVSPRTGDGKTTIAFNLASVIAQSAPRTLLIDGDLRNRSLTRILAPDLAGGLPVLLEGGEVAMADQIVRNGLGFHLIGAGAGHTPAHPSDLLSSREMRELLDRLRKACDYILIDLPSVLERIDVAACADLIDAFVLVAHADRTSLDDLEHALRTSNVMAERLVGVVVNQSRRSAGMAYSR
jgi:polysaccharide biosynthesis transport protein